jgi:hypothetical protein
MFNIPEGAFPIEAITPQAGAAITGDYISLKNAQRALVVVHINQAAADTVAITLEQATAVANTGSKAISTSVAIWANEDCAASDTMVAQTAAVGFTTSAAQKHKVIVFDVDPAGLEEGFDCLTVKTGASNAGNITSAMYYVVPRYASKASTQPSYITD